MLTRIGRRAGWKAGAMLRIDLTRLKFDVRLDHTSADVSHSIGRFEAGDWRWRKRLRGYRKISRARWLQLFQRLHDRMWYEPKSEGKVLGGNGMFIGGTVKQGG